MCKLKPRCFVENKEHYGWLQGIAYTSDGYLLPCCWLDSIGYKQDLERLNLLDESLKLENNEVEDIINSEQWKEFFRVLVEDPDNAPCKCKLKCKDE